MYICRTEGRHTPLHVVIYLVRDYICKGGAALTYVEVVLDLCGVDSVHDVNDEGYTPIEVLMMLVCIRPSDGSVSNIRYFTVAS